jgi:hypothetical protein
LQYFLKVLELIFAWLQKFPELIDSYNEGIKKPDLVFTDPKVALAFAWPELLMTLSRLFESSDKRTRRFFTREMEIEMPGFNRESALYVEPNCLKSMASLRLIEQFYKMEGFKLILEIVGLE